MARMPMIKTTALVAAETGHLVIATCHTPNSYLTVERVVAVFPPDQQNQATTQLANCLQGIIAQRLIPAIDKKRRLLATELLVATSAVRNLIRDNQLHQLINILQTGKRLGMHTMDDSLIQLYEAGEISYDAAISNSHNPEGLKTKLHRQ